MQPDEKIAALLSVRELDTPERFIVMCTRKGTVKKTELASFSNPRAGGIIAIGVDEGDALMSVRLSDGKSDIFFGTRDGMAIGFRKMTSGPWAGPLMASAASRCDDDDVVGWRCCARGPILTVTEMGYGGPPSTSIACRAAAGPIIT
jgi:DNA gyrase subunit A